MIDNEGRLFGRWNVIDVAAVLIVVLLIVVGYGAYALFRTPAPAISTITPAEVRQHEVKPIVITGQNLRAFLRVRIGTVEGTMLIESPTKAEIRVPDELMPGKYDLALFDEAREIVRLPQVVTVLPPPPPAPPPPPPPAPPKPEVEMQAVGAFVALSDREAQSIRSGMTLLPPNGTAENAVGRILAAQRPERGHQRVVISDRNNTTVDAPAPGTFQVNAIVRVRCFVNAAHCYVAEAQVGEGTVVPFSLHAGSGGPAPAGRVNFRVDEIRPVNSVVAFRLPDSDLTVHVRLIVPAENRDLVAVGDADRLGGAVLTLLGNRWEPITGSSTVVGTTVIPRSLLLVDGTFRVHATFGANGWEYAGRPLRASETFGFETLRYSVGGAITDVQLPAAKAASTR